MTSIKQKSTNELGKLFDAWERLGDSSPLAALRCAADTKWLIDGVIASGSVNWVVASPSSFKTFVAIDMATCVSTGRAWHGRETSEAVVLYIAGEGDADVQVRRAAAEMAAGEAGLLAIAQVRPRLDTPEGLPALTALIDSATIGDSILFAETGAYYGGDDDDWQNKYLTPEELTKYERLRDAALKAQDLYHKNSPEAVRDPNLSADENIARYRAITSAHAEKHRIELEEIHRLWQQAEDYKTALAKPRANTYDTTMLKYIEIAPRLSLEDFGAVGASSKNVFLVIDTYSQTSADDTKGTVSAYIKTLKEMQDKYKAAGGTLTILVIDHTTKSGDSYMGSLAKEGDSDSMIEVNRRGNDYSVTLNNTKMRSAACFEPIHLELQPFTLDGFNDALGRPLKSLIVVDGENNHKFRKLAGNRGETAAAVLLSLLAQNGAQSKPDLRDLFTSHGSNVKKTKSAISRAFDRALSHLEINGLVFTDSSGFISPVGEGDLLA